MSGSGSNTLQSCRDAHNGYLCAWRVYFSHSAVVICFHGRVIHTLLVFIRCCTDIFVLQEWWGLRRKTKFRVPSLGTDLNWGAWTSPSFLYPCLVLTLVWVFLLANSRHYVFVCVCSSQSGVPEVQNLGRNSPYLCAHLSPQTLKNLRWWKTSKGKPINKLTQWLQEFLRKSAKAKEFRIQAGKTSLQFGTHQQDGFYPSLCL